MPDRNKQSLKAQLLFASSLALLTFGTVQNSTHAAEVNASSTVKTSQTSASSSSAASSAKGSAVKATSSAASASSQSSSVKNIDSTLKQATLNSNQQSQKNKAEVQSSSSNKTQSSQKAVSTEAANKQASSAAQSQSSQANKSNSVSQARQASTASAAKTQVKTGVQQPAKISSSSSVLKKAVSQKASLKQIKPKAQVRKVNAKAVKSQQGMAYVTVGSKRYTRVDAVDVSSYQSWMTLNDYRKLKARGVKTVIVKVSQGTGYTNPFAFSEISRARKAGLSVAVYHYANFHSKASGSAEGRHAGNVMKLLRLPKTTLVFADMEDTSTYSRGVGTYLKSFWKSLDALGFHNHAVYTYQSYPYHTAVSNTVGRKRTWIAQYPYTPIRNGYYERSWRRQGYGAWQFSDNVHIPGRSGALDGSVDFNGLLSGIKPLSQNHKKANGVSKGKLYSNKKAVKKAGLHRVKGKLYLTSKSGKVKTGFQYNPKTHKTAYFSKKHGYMLTGLHKINGHYYLLESDGAIARGWRRHKGHVFYFDKKGHEVRGFHRVDGRDYYFSRKNGHRLAGRIFRLKGKKHAKAFHYYLDANGVIQHKWQLINNKYYYFNKYGHELRGFHRIDGRDYYFSRKNGHRLAGRIFRLKARKNVKAFHYYLDADGVIQHKWQLINNKYYYFDDKGHEIRGFRKIDGQDYYFSRKNGHRLARKYPHFYRLKAKKHAKAHYYFLDGNGIIQHGFREIDSKYYYFTMKSGRRVTGVHKIHGKVLRFSKKDGHLLTKIDPIELGL